LTIRREREEERICYNIVEVKFPLGNLQEGDFLINGKWA